MKQDILSPWALKLFTTIVETGSFSRAAQELDCAQSAVSYGITNLEAQLGVDLFVRGRRRPVLTEVGKAILSDARNIEIKLLDLRARAAEYRRGVETKVSFSVDAMYPLEQLVLSLHAFTKKFPGVAVDLRVEALGKVLQSVLERDCDFGICGPADHWPDAVDVVTLEETELVPVASPNHPLAQPKNVSTSELRKHVQLMLSNSSSVKMGQEFCMYATHQWHVNDICTKHRLLRAGVGWGTMPIHLIRDDLASRKLVLLNLESLKSVGYMFHMVNRLNETRGPVSSWLMNALRQR